MKSLLAILICAGINASALELKDIVGKYAVGSGCDMSVSPKRVYITLKSYKNTGKPYLEVYFYGEDATFTEISLESSSKEVIGSDGRKWTSIKTVQNSTDSLISTQILFNGNKASAQTTVESLKKQNGFLVYDSKMTNAQGQKMLADHCPLYKTN